MTHAEIDEVVTNWANAIAEQINEGEVERDEPHDAIFEAVDDGWTELGMPAGRIDEWPSNPGGEVLRGLGDIIDYCESEAWLEDDYGLWEGLNGAAVLGCQAFFSLQNVLWQKLRDMNVID